MSMCDYEIVDKDGKIIPITGRKYIESEILYPRKFFEKIQTLSLWSKLFNAELCKKIKSPEYRIMSEDASIIHYLISMCEKIVVTDKKLYQYVMHEDSACGEVRHSFNHKKMNDQIEVYFERYEFFKAKSIFKQAEKELLSAFSVIFSSIKYGYYFKNKNFIVINREALFIIKETLKREKINSIKIFAFVIQKIIKNIFRIPLYVFKRFKAAF